MKTKGFTPVLDEIRDKVGGTAALVYGVMYRYSKMSDFRVCTASQTKIAERCGFKSRDTVIKAQKILDTEGYITKVGYAQGGTVSWSCNLELKGEVEFRVSEKTTPPVEKTDTKRVFKKDNKDYLDFVLENNLKKHQGFDNTWFPPDVGEYLAEFTTIFKGRYSREATKSERGYWIKECREWLQRGYKPEQVNGAWQYAVDRDILIKSPRSITFAFDQLSADTGDMFAREI